MKYLLEIKEEAEFETLEAYLYYEEQQKDLGRKFLFCLEEYFDRICKNPLHYPLKNGYRETFIRKFPYLIIYEINQNKIIVYSVFNTHQNPEKKP